MNVNLVKTTNYWNKLLSNAIGSDSVAGVLSTSKIGLGTAIITPGPQTNFAAVAEANFTGYIESATIVWTGIGNELDGSQSSFAPSHLFLCTGSSSVQGIANCFVTDGVGTASVGNASTGLFGCCKITPPITIQNPGDYVQILIQWNEGVASANSNADVQN